ncbi:MAG: transcriptional repressor [Oscillospiraceae bacterium]
MAEYRNTIQRKLVFDAVVELKGSHPTPDEVYKHLYKKYPSVSRSTVYRNLNILSDQGEILRVKISNAADRMDANNAFHYHIYCEKCGRVDDIEMLLINDLEKKIENDFGYKVKSYNIVFTGLCPLCKSNIIKKEV